MLPAYWRLGRPRSREWASLGDTDHVERNAYARCACCGPRYSPFRPEAPTRLCAAVTAAVRARSPRHVADVDVCEGPGRDELADAGTNRDEKVAMIVDRAYEIALFVLGCIDRLRAR